MKGKTNFSFMMCITGFIFFHQLCFATYYSQCGQDQYVNEHYFKNRRDGVFIEIGTHNGMTYSNTYFFEKELGWTGICVEPLPERFAELRACRSCICIQGCVADTSGVSKLLKVSSPLVNVEMLSGLQHKYDPRHFERMKTEVGTYGGSYQYIDVQCYKLNDLLGKNAITHVNFLSIDTEGGEFDILASIDFSRFKIDVITVEDNYEDSRFISFLGEKGYALVTRLGQDLLFVHKDFKN